MTPEQKLSKLKSILEILKEDQVTPEQLRTVADEFLKVAKHIQTTLESKVEESNGQNTAQIQGIRASIAQVEKLVSKVRDDLFLDLTEARDRFERDIKGVQSSIPTVPDLSYLEQGIEDVRNRIPTVPDIAPLAEGLEEVRENVEETNEKIQSLSDRIEKVRTTAPAPGGMPTLRLHVNGSYIGNTRDLFLSGSGVSSTVTNGHQTIVITGDGAGFSIETPTGTIDAVNTSFVCSKAPQYMIADGISYFNNKGYSIAGLTVTFDVPPSQYVRAII